MHLGVVISLITLLLLIDATKMAKICQWCGEKTRQLERHKEECRRRAKKMRRGELSDGEEAPDEVVIRVLKHKTSARLKSGLSIIIEKELHEVVISLYNFDFFTNSKHSVMQYFAIE